MHKLVFFLFLTSFMGTQALAARPFVTDDARLTTSGSCQVETWTRQYRNSQEYWALPACNPTGNLEFTFGGARAGREGEPFTSDRLFQIKTLFRELQTNNWGWGLGVGRVNHPGSVAGPNLFGNTYAYIPVSWSLRDDQTVLHLNTGWLRDRLTGDNRTTLGLGGEFKLQDRLLGIAEIYGDNTTKPYFQVGARYNVIPGFFQVDGTIGGQYSGDRETRWISIGIRLTPDKVF